MNTQSNATPEPHAEARVAPPLISESRRLYWCVRRELWEYRSIYIAPLVVAGVFLLAFLFGSVHYRDKVRAAASAGSAQLHAAIVDPYNFSALLIMGVTTLIAIFYCLDSLHGERRDRSILFWKSLPVSDLTTVLSKAVVPILVLPVITLAVTVATQWLMLLISSVVVPGDGISVGSLWAHAPQMWLVLLYHDIGIHGFWFAPIYGWLLLVSAWSRRAAFLWAFLPPVAIIGVEWIAFSTKHFARMLGRQLGGAPDVATFPPTMHSTMHMSPAPFIVSPGLWIGLAITAAFLAGAVRLRRQRGPI